MSIEEITRTVSQNLDSLLNEGSFVKSLFLAYFGGVLSSFTPCVYPMIPITIGVVGGMSDHHAKKSNVIFLRGIVYVLGMAVVYSLLGILASISGKLFGSFTNTSGWYLTLGMILILSALMMMEVFTFDPISLWSSFKHFFGIKSNHATGEKKSGASLVGAFALGASSGLIAAPCTTPVLSLVLTFIAKSQSPLQGMALMFMFSLGLGTLLLLIAVFAGFLKVLPKSGKWMVTFKKWSGFILLAMAEYLIFKAGSLGGII